MGLSQFSNIYLNLLVLNENYKHRTHTKKVDGRR